MKSEHYHTTGAVRDSLNVSWGVCNYRLHPFPSTTDAEASVCLSGPVVSFLAMITLVTEHYGCGWWLRTSTALPSLTMPPSEQIWSVSRLVSHLTLTFSLSLQARLPLLWFLPFSISSFSLVFFMQPFFISPTGVPPAPVITMFTSDYLEITWDSGCSLLKLSEGDCDVRYRSEGQQKWSEVRELTMGYPLNQSIL